MYIYVCMYTHVRREFFCHQHFGIEIFERIGLSKIRTVKFLDLQNSKKSALKYARIRKTQPKSTKFSS